MTSSVECTHSSRKLGHQELLFNSFNQFTSPIGVYVTINIIESKREISLDEVKKAFEKASETNFLLRARVNEDGAFEPISEIRLKKDWMSVEETALELEEDWTQALPQFLERKIDFLNGPLWYGKWIKITNNLNDTGVSFTYNLIVAFSHIISDGKSGFNLIYNHILPYLNKRTPKEKPIYFGNALESAVYNFNENQLSLHQRSVPLLFRSVTNAFVLKRKIERSFSRLLNSNNPTPEVLLNQFNAMSIDKETSAGLIRLCKQKRVTVHSLLMVIVHNALHLAKRNYQVNLSTDVLLYPIDARKFVPELNSTSKMPLGDYHKMGQQVMKFASIENETSFFQMAQEANAGVKVHNQPLQENTSFDCCFHLLQKDVLSLETFNSLPPPSVFSNLGNCDVMCKDDSDIHDDVVLKRHFFTLETCSGVFISVCSYKGQMRFVVSNGKLLSEGPSKFVAKVIKSNIEYLVKIYLGD